MCVSILNSALDQVHLLALINDKLSIIDRAPMKHEEREHQYIDLLRREHYLYTLLHKKMRHFLREREVCGFQIERRVHASHNCPFTLLLETQVSFQGIFSFNFHSRAFPNLNTQGPKSVHITISTLPTLTRCPQPNYTYFCGHTKHMSKIEIKVMEHYIMEWKYASRQNYKDAH